MKGKNGAIEQGRKRRDENYRGDERQMDLCDGWRGGRMKGYSVEMIVTENTQMCN